MSESWFELDLPGPLDVPASVQRFSRWGDDLMDRWDGRVLARVAHLPGGPAPFLAESVGSLERPRLRVRTASAAAEPELATLLRGMFVQEDIAPLAARDPAVARASARFPGVRPVVERHPLTALVRSISAQQVNLRWAAETRRRLVQAFGRRHVLDGIEIWSLDGERLAAAAPEAIRALQFTTRKAGYIVGVAQHIAADQLRFTELEALPNDEVLRRLTAIPGIGRWSAEWYLARTLARPVVAAGDLGVRKAVGQAYFEGRLPSEDETRQATRHWGAAAGVAQQLLLEELYAGNRPVKAR